MREPAYFDDFARVWQGDALETLRELPSSSAHTCVTSPPFFGLRDYGTGTWEGGAEDCDHIESVGGKQGAAGNTLGRDAGHPDRTSLPATKHALIEQKYKNECGKCGAVRADRQIGLEETPEEWCANLVDVFREVWRVLRDDGTLWLEIGDSYASTSKGSGGTGRSTLDQYTDYDHAERDFDLAAMGVKTKDLIGAPWLLAFALRADGWYLRSDIIWNRPNPMPESVRDRPTKSHSYVFLLSKRPRYYWDAEAIREESTGDQNPRNTNGPRPRTDKIRGFDNRVTSPTRNVRSVWTIPTQPLPYDHYAAYPEALVERCIKAGTSERGVCAECGDPWEREIEKGEPELHPDVYSAKGAAQYDDRERGMVPKPLESGSTLKHIVPRETTGWAPTCNHDAGVVPATVLDPFMGSGTTALAARALGRRSIGVELNPEYIDITRDRLKQLTLV